MGNTSIGPVATANKAWRIFAVLLAQATVMYAFEPSRSMPIQMDLGASKHITICTGLKRFISCRDGSNIAITYAFWGRTSDKICPSDDGDPVTDCEGADETMGLVQKYCETKGECQLEARHNKLQKNGTHHCPGVNKYLIVNYTCIPESKGVMLCDSEKTTLECRAGWKMELTEVFWGRRASTKFCGTDEGMECDSSDFAGKYLKAKCLGKQRCEIAASSDVLDDKKAPCAGMLKYLLVSYQCKPAKAFKVNNVDDDNDSEVENKLLTDTSSKELMGLLEKHLNEIKTPESNMKEAKSGPDDKKIDPSKQYTPTHASSKPGPAFNAAAKPKSRETLGRLGQALYATEDEDITNSLLSGPAFTRTIKNDKPKDEPAKKKDQTPSQPSTTPPAAAPAKKDQTEAATTKKDVTEAPAADDAKEKEKITQAETPVADLKETASAKKSPGSAPEVAKGAVAKDTVPKVGTPTTETDQYEVSEPQTVKSILARAKEVLKTLDNDSDEGSNLNKKSGIARKEAGANDATIQAAKQVENLAQSLADANPRSKISDSKITSSKIQQAAASSVQKPKPGPQKNGMQATGQGTAGVGNTP